MFNMYTKLTTALSAFALLISGGAWGQCADGEFAVDFALTAGSYPNEITWQLNDEAGNNLFSGGAPDGATWCLAEGTYTFFGSDSYGDGWNGAVATFTINGITTSFTVEGAQWALSCSGEQRHPRLHRRCCLQLQCRRHRRRRFLLFRKCHVPQPF